MTAVRDLWIFGYGSLMWRPDFAFVERRSARLTGFHRCFCIASTHHRGNDKRPGLVLGLDRGGYCVGVAYRVSKDDERSVLNYLRKRELVNGVYREAVTPVRLDDGREVEAIAYIVERAHPSYAPPAPLARQALLIRGARGLSGDNLDYLVNTVRHLMACGIRERALERLVTVAAPHVAHLAADGDGFASPSAAALRKCVARMPVEVRRLRKGERRRFLYRLRLSGVWA